MRLYIVVWKSYGDWRSTMPFPDERAAQRHIDRNIQHSIDRAREAGDTSQYANMQIIPIDVAV